MSTKRRLASFSSASRSSNAASFEPSAVRPDSASAKALVALIAASRSLAMCPCSTATSFLWVMKTASSSASLASDASFRASASARAAALRSSLCRTFSSIAANWSLNLASASISARCCSSASRSFSCAMASASSAVFASRAASTVWSSLRAAK